MRSARIGTSLPRAWIGRWTVAVAAVHTLFAGVALREPLTDIVERGVLDAVGTDPLSAATAWFVLFGCLLFVLGLAISALERSTPSAVVPVGLGWAMLGICALGIVLMPISGFYLLLVPALAIFARRRAVARTRRASAPAP